MWKRLAVVICSLTIIGSNQVGQLNAAEEQGVSCTLGWHSYIISPNTFCFSGWEEEGGYDGCVWVRDNPCRQANVQIADSEACYGWPAGVSVTCQWMAGTN